MFQHSFVNCLEDCYNPCLRINRRQVPGDTAKDIFDGDCFLIVVNEALQVSANLR